MRHKAAAAGLSEAIEVDSAGTGDWHIGKPPHEGTRKLLDQWGISHQGMLARQVASAADFAGYDYIICMDSNNYRDVRELLGSTPSVPAHAVMPFMDLVHGSQLAEVPDPYYTGNFQEVYELIEAGCNQLLARIRASLDEGR